MSINESLDASLTPLIEEKFTVDALFDKFRKLVVFMVELLIILTVCSYFPSRVVTMDEGRNFSK